MQENQIDADFGALYQLQDAICLLASSSEVQADYLNRHGYGECLDELALNLEAWMPQPLKLSSLSICITQPVISNIEGASVLGFGLNEANKRIP